MIFFKAAPAVVFLLTVTCVARADKKIELQDIEEDNLKSEKEKDQVSEPRSQSATGIGRDLLPLEFLKNGLLRYFEHPQVPPQPRFVHQYAVTEPPEKQNVAPKPQYGPPAPQQAMVGYLSNVPMQIYLVPQYYNEPNEQASNAQSGIQYATPSVGRVANYPTASEVAQPQPNYIEVPQYVTPTGKAYAAPQYPQITYVTYAPQPTSAPNIPMATVISGPGGITGPQATVTPLMSYSMPLLQYPTSIYTKAYYSDYGQQADTNTIEEVQQNEANSQKHYPTQAEHPYMKAPSSEYPRYYTSRAPFREEHRHHPVPELPPPPPILLRSQPPHLAGIPKALPMFRPISKPVYSPPGNLIPNIIPPRPSDAYGFPKKRPSSLLESYIPSNIQLEYLKRGYTKDPLSVYEALSSGRAGFPPHPHVIPRHFERGFLPNQMYHTGAGGITYGHYKRTPKSDKSSLRK